MKKLVFMAVLMIVITAAAFSQTYTLKKVSGTVEFLDGKDWKAVTEKTTLKPDTQVRSKKIGSSLDIALGDDVMTIRPASEGKTVSDLIRSVKQIGSASKFDTGEVSRDKDTVITASARASDAQAALKIEEE